MNKFDQLFEQYIGLVYEKQLIVEDYITNISCSINYENCTAVFSSGLEFKVQLLGSFVHSLNSWIWGWAVEDWLNYPDILQNAVELHRYGRENDIPEFLTPCFDASDTFTSLMGVVAAGLLNSSFYFISNQGKENILLTIDAGDVNKSMLNNPDNVAVVFPELIEQFDINHKNALLSYLDKKGFATVVNTDRIKATCGTYKLDAEFNEHGKLLSLSEEM